jgi:hypothetical protein
MMSKSVIPLQQGEDFQADFFWYQATRLFMPYTNISRVGFELDAPKSFDDVAVWYDPSDYDEWRKPVNADFYQVKFHVDYSGSVTAASLSDPEFINAKEVSLLQRLSDAKKEQSQNGKQARFILVTNWQIPPKDPLASIVSTQNGEFRLDRFFRKQSTSKLSSLRSMWVQHLGLKDEDELRDTIATFRIWPGFLTAHNLASQLSDRLVAAGLNPVSPRSSVNPYRSMIRRLLGAGQRVFSANDLRCVCTEENLWKAEQTGSDDSIIKLGVRSFMTWASYLQDEVQYLVDFTPCFENRYIRDLKLWNEKIRPELIAFLHQNIRPGKEYQIFLETHSSLAFTTGYILGSKAGASISPVQKTQRGRELWPAITARQLDTQLKWQFSIESSPRGNGITIAVSVTHDVVRDVQGYMRQHGIVPELILKARINPEPSQAAMVDGTHAFTAAQQLTAWIRQNRSQKLNKPHMHVFIAAPNGFTFFFGQLSQGLGTFTLYEYDFGTGQLGGYKPSVTLP